MDTTTRPGHADAAITARKLRILPGSAASPLDADFLDYLCHQTKESAEWDFKEKIDTRKGSDFAKIAKDIFGFSNNGGGYLLFGWRDKPFEAVGLPDDFHLDPAELQEKFNSYSSMKISLDFVVFPREIDGVKKRFAVLYVPPSPGALTPVKDGDFTDHKGKDRKAFRAGEILIRRGTQSVVAEPHEVRWIERRAREDEYQISLVSGVPDEVEEALESNLFPVVRLPKTIFVAKQSTPTIPRDVAFAYPHVAKSGYVYALENPVESGLRPYVLHHHVTEVTLTKWAETEEGADGLVWLLNDTVRAHARTRGLFLQEKFGRVFFPTNAKEQPRMVKWRGLKRRGARRVAWKVYAASLKAEVFVHEAAGLRFIRLGDGILLQITPTYVLSEDGRRPIRNPRVGPVITGLLHNKFNAACLRDTHFWAEQLETSETEISLLGGRLVIARRPLSSQVGHGIRGDYFDAIEAIEVEETFEALSRSPPGNADQSEPGEEGEE